MFRKNIQKQIKQNAKTAVKLDKKRNYERALPYYEKTLELIHTSNFEELFDVDTSSDLRDIGIQYMNRRREILAHLNFKKLEIKETKTEWKVDKEKLEGLTEEYEFVKRTIAITKPNIPFDKVIGQQEAKKKLTDAVLKRITKPHLYNDGLKPSQGVLLYGPPGNNDVHI